MDVVPLWMKLMFGPGIIWFILTPWIGAKLAWNFIFSNTRDEVGKKDKKASVFKTWLTVFLCNLLSCIVLLIVEFFIRKVFTTIPWLSSLKIWNDPLTVIVYAIPVIISFFVISSQIRKRAAYLIRDRAPARIASWVMAVFYTPWYILVPISLFIDMSEILKPIVM